MRIIRYERDSAKHYGVVDGEHVHRLAGLPFGEIDIREEVGPLEDVTLLAPCEPTKVIGVGANYRSVLESRGAPLPETPNMFLKAPNSVVGPMAAIERPEPVDEMFFEGEMCLVMGRRARNLSQGECEDHVLGITCGNDVTVRDWLPGVQWLRGKSLDTHCPLGPWIETGMSIAEPLRVQTRVNGEIKQDGETSDLIFDPFDILVFVTEWITLEPGDVVMTGTPLGMGPLVDGDVVEVEVEGVGVLVNPVQTSRSG